MTGIALMEIFHLTKAGIDTREGKEGKVANEPASGMTRLGLCAFPESESANA